ncbi:MAG: hypothetical protein CL916_13580 [Deltaproteobacteria bacterium]|nr:hypothetical protein [Deltaproteobacteria bacterium]
MDTWIVAAILIGGIIVIFGGLAIIVAKFYRKVDQGQALIINKMKDEPEVTFTGGVVYPIIHRAEIIDISVKRIDIDRRGKNGLICKDYLRADINVNFFVRINPIKEKVLEVASTIGCKRASDLAALDELFNAKFSEALKTAGKQFEFAALFDKRDDFREKVKEVIGEDLNGFVLEDVAIDYLEQTDLKFLNVNDTNDAQGIEKIVRITKEKQVIEARLSNEAEAQIANEDVKKWERIKLAERQKSEIDENTTQAKEEARIKREREVSTKELTKEKDIELQRKNDEAEMLAAEQAKMRKAEAALKDREKALLIKEEENMAEKLRLQKKREELAIVLDLQKQTKAEEESSKLKRAEGIKIEAEETNKTIIEREQAERTKVSTIITAQAEAEELRIKEEEKAEAAKKVAEIESQMASFDLKKTEIETESQKMRAEAQAFEKERLADAQAKEFAATEMAKVQVERDREDLRKIKISNDDLELNIVDRKGNVDAENLKRQGAAKAENIRAEGVAKAANIQDEGSAQAELLRSQGLAEADVEERNVNIAERANEIEANRIRQIKFAEAEGISKLADAQKLMDSISQEREEFRLKLDKQTEIALAKIAVRRDIAKSQAGVLAEAFKATDIKIIGGDGDFFDRFVHAASIGQALDATMDNSQTLQAISHDYVEGEGNLIKEVGNILSSPTLQASNLRDLSLTALLASLSSEASGEQKKLLQKLLAKATDLEKGK